MADPVVATPPETPAQTFVDAGKHIVQTVASWMLAETIAAKARWNTITDGDTIVSRGIEMVEAMAKHRGIPPGYVTTTPHELVSEMQAQAVATNAPTHDLPMAVVNVAPPAPATPVPPAASPQIPVARPISEVSPPPAPPGPLAP
jgi:hypothetical protein